jgi:hypothetical protein
MRSDNVGAAIRGQQRAALIDARRARVGELKCELKSLRQTIEILTKERSINPETNAPWSVDTIAEDLVYMRGVWQENAKRDISQVMQDELAKLDRVEVAAWTAWEKSCADAITNVAKITPRGAEKSTSITGQAGDQRFLATVLECQKRRAAMRGMDAPTKIEQLNKQDGPIEHKLDMSKLSDEDIERGLELSRKMYGTGDTEKAAPSPAKESASDDAANP